MPEQQILKSLGATIEAALQTAIQHDIPTVAYMLSMASLAVKEASEKNRESRSTATRRAS